MNEDKERDEIRTMLQKASDLIDTMESKLMDAGMNITKELKEELDDIQKQIETIHAEARTRLYKMVVEDEAVRDSEEG